ncbi:MAG: IS21-like element helper ATPase IstB [Holophagales bacterium]|jgi:DNA replication protein DnaC|nr:IS21-like element helper ATPase IstB [Holophagales bacterium]
MITGQSFDTMRNLHLNAMTNEYRRQYELFSAMDSLTFDERLDMLLEAERIFRENRKIKQLTKAANLRDKSACLENLDYDPVRKLDRAQIARLSGCDWIRKRRNLFICGKCGTGKTFLSSAFGSAAVRLGFSVRSIKMTRLMADLKAAANTGTLPKFLRDLKKPSLLILDDFGLAPLDVQRCMDFYDVVDDRQDTGAILITAQLPVSEWHSMFEDATHADAILDRLVHNSDRIDMQGPSRRRRTNVEMEDPPDNKLMQKS